MKTRENFTAEIVHASGVELLKGTFAVGLSDGNPDLVTVEVCCEGLASRSITVDADELESLFSALHRKRVSWEAEQRRFLESEREAATRNTGALK